jgi:homoserine kinase type II
VTRPPEASVVAEALSRYCGFAPTSVNAGPSGTATVNYLTEDRDGRRWFVKAYPGGIDLTAEERGPSP